MSAPPILALESIAKAYGRHQVLKGVDLALEPGKLVAVAGENGSGKSTLLKIIVGLLKPDAGQSTVNGPLGYCPQESALFSNLTVGEHFRLFARGYDCVDWKKQSRTLMERFRFAAYADVLVKKVSGGTRQKLNLCLALLHDPMLLVLDEPYAGFDWETYLLFWELADELLPRDRTLLVVSHLIYDRERFDAVYELCDGRLQCD